MHFQTLETNPNGRYLFWGAVWYIVQLQVTKIDFWENKLGEG